MAGSDSDGPPPLVDDSGDVGYGDWTTKDHNGNPLDQSTSSSGTSEGSIRLSWQHAGFSASINTYLQRVYDRTAAMY